MTTTITIELTAAEVKELREAFWAEVNTDAWSPVSHKVTVKVAKALPEPSPQVGDLVNVLTNKGVVLDNDLGRGELLFSNDEYFVVRFTDYQGSTHVDAFDHRDFRVEKRS